MWFHIWLKYLPTWTYWAEIENTILKNCQIIVHILKNKVLFTHAVIIHYLIQNLGLLGALILAKAVHLQILVY